MRIAFYAPMKSPRADTPSGDRLIARLLMKALRTAGHQVELVSIFRSYDGSGNSRRQERLRKIGRKIAARTVRRLTMNKPDLWFTYHLYHKAPDWVGPAVAQKFGIPYVVAEASFSPKQQGGQWSGGHAEVARILAQTDMVVGLSKTDEVCVMPRLNANARYLHLPPFLDTAPFACAQTERGARRQYLVSEKALNPDVPWLLVVAMMRQGDKVQSYEILAKALAKLADRPWQLIVAGDGPAADTVKKFFSQFNERVIWMGLQHPDDLPQLYAAADIFVWPAVKETPGMCFLEAGAAGLPVVGGDGYGVPDVVQHGETGLLARHLDAESFAQKLTTLLDERGKRDDMGAEASRYVQVHHDISSVGKTLDKALRELLR